MAKKSNSLSKTAVWILLGLLMVSLVGFGATGLSGNIRVIGHVGDKPIPVQQYARQLQQEIRAIEAQTRQPLPFAQAQQIGLDRAVLQRLIGQRALDHETEQLGLSIGDESLRERILDIPAFQGIDGTFDREGYRFALEQGGISEAAFETSLREEAARTLLQGAIISGVEMPRTYARTLVDFVAEQRSFTWSLLTAEDLETPIPAPSDADLRSYFDENGADFTLPQTKRLVYAALLPDALIDEIEIPEADLQAAYEERIDEYNQPERRLVERLVFPDQEAADQAAAALEVGGTTFEALVEDRGLTLADVDMGDMGRLELDAAGEAVFGAEPGEVTGPHASTLGPALFRVNGVLPAQNTTFEEARPALQNALASDRAVRQVEALAQDYEDRLAGGATLEELVTETEMTLGSLDWTATSSDGIAAYAAFREAAAEVTTEDFPTILQLDDGGIFALRLEEDLPERPATFDEAQEDVRTAWIARRTIDALETLASAALEGLANGQSFEEAGLTPRIEENLSRNGFVPAAPAGLLTELFEMAPAEARQIASDSSLAIVRLDTITPAGDSPETANLLEQLGTQLDQALAQDLFNIFTDDVTQRAGPQIDQQALAAVHVNFP